MTFYKFLGANLSSNNDEGTFYPAPTCKNGKWEPGAWVTVKDADRASVGVCGRGLHLMKVCIPRYGRYTGNCFTAEGRALIAEDNEKARFKSARLLQPVMPKEIFKPRANLSGATLSGALNVPELSKEQKKQVNAE